MKLSVRDRFVDDFIARCGPEDRVEELRHHFFDQRAAGRHAEASELVSLFVLFARTKLVSGLRDIPFGSLGCR